VEPAAADTLPVGHLWSAAILHSNGRGGRLILQNSIRASAANLRGSEINKAVAIRNGFQFHSKVLNWSEFLFV
jgi:hypothetical protein